MPSSAVPTVSTTVYEKNGSGKYINLECAREIHYGEDKSISNFGSTVEERIDMKCKQLIFFIACR